MILQNILQILQNNKFLKAHLQIQKIIIIKNPIVIVQTDLILTEEADLILTEEAEG